MHEYSTRPVAGVFALVLPGAELWLEKEICIGRLIGRS